MGLTISEADYVQLWQQTSAAGSGDPSEEIEQCPQELGTGHRRWVALREIDLLIHDYRFHEDVQIHYSANDGCLEFGFQLRGGSYAKRQSGQSFVQNGPSNAEVVCEQSEEHILQVDIHLESIDCLQSFVPTDSEQASSAIQRLVQASGRYPYTQIGETTSTMQFVLNQLLNCPYQGLTKQIYLESKCWELVALKLEQLKLEQLTQETPPQSTTHLKVDDIDRIYAAKAILTRHWQAPPSLLDLARQVGLNDYKLKLGFRQVFGTTAFGYLWHYRMEQARQLLTAGQHNIKEVAALVGYSKQSNFAAAFRKKFGVNPKVFQSSQVTFHKNPSNSQKNPFCS